MKRKSVHRAAIALAIVGNLVLLLKQEAFEHADAPNQKRVFTPERESLRPARAEYFFNLLRDPATNRIPPNIRARELAYAHTLNHTTDQLFKTSGNNRFDWFEVGPTNIGGRTRALALDLGNSNVMLAGAASGGIWKSGDRGGSWTLMTEPSQSLSVTSLAQDPRPGHTNVWYYTSGEFKPRHTERLHTSFYGTGLYKSTDNGETWNHLPSTSHPNQSDYNFPFDLLARVIISPTTGSVFLASNHHGIYRSDDDGSSFAYVLGTPWAHSRPDVAVASDGTLLATLSALIPKAGGVFTSTDDGLTWSNITPATFPDIPGRSVAAFAPSNPDIAYVFTTPYSEVSGGISAEEVTFHKFTLSDGRSEDRSNNLPEWDVLAGWILTYGGYTMVLAVKPDDEDFVVFGGWNLLRSRDGLLTRSTSMDEGWIGGYPHDLAGQTNPINQGKPISERTNYENHHADQHVAIFDPANPDILYSGHDGGISVSLDISAAHVSWERLNNGYNVTQFYTVAIPQAPGDNRIMGGTQDNATPYIRWQPKQLMAAANVGGGDGSYAYFGDEHAYISYQFGRIYRLNYDEQLNPISRGVQDVPEIIPPGSPRREFVHPFAVDPSNEELLYYPDGTDIWRNDELNTYPIEGAVSQGWKKIVQTGLEDSYAISALAISQHPAHVLYFAASSTTGAPRFYRLDQANTDSPRLQFLIQLVALSGSYIHSIAINPDDADEILVVLSNYTVRGLFHSRDAGLNFSLVEGNLEGTLSQPGPSLRSATILPVPGATYYILGTSTGLYAVSELEGMNTEWIQQGIDVIGNAIVEFVTSRRSDGVVAAATYGRGLFVGSFQSPLAVSPSVQPVAFQLGQNYPNPANPSTTIPFTLSRSGKVTLTLYDILGRKVRHIISKERRTSGRHEVGVNLSSLASGLYIYRLDVAGEISGDATFSQARKITVLK